MLPESPMSIRIRAVALLVTLAVLHTASAEPVRIRPERELLITNSAVVDDARAKYPGPWSFGGLIDEMVGQENAGACVHAWLESWAVAQNVNGFHVPPRPGILTKLVEPWQKKDGFDPKSGKQWIPKLENAPFRLIGIVNRMDLCAAQLADVVGHTREQWKTAGKQPLFEALLDRATSSPGGGTRKITVPALAVLNLAAFEQKFRNEPRFPNNRPPSRSFGPYGFRAPNDELQFGEGRLIFGAVDEKGQPLPGDWTLIFEYKLQGEGEPKKKPASDPSSNSKELPKDDLERATHRRTLREWTSLWHALGGLEPGTEAYALKLEKITRIFTHRIAPNDEIPIGQVRSSEAAFGAGREFRQFRLVQGKLALEPLAQTPAPEFAKKDGPETRVLAEFLREGSALIRSGIHVVPQSLKLRNEVIPVLGGNAIIPADKPDFRWDLHNGVAGPVRRIFSLNTCTGCHAGETACTGLHVSPRAEGGAAVLSSFLRMDGIPLHTYDKVSAQKVAFNEMGERAEIFAALMDRTDRKRMDDLRNVLRERIGRSH